MEQRLVLPMVLQELQLPQVLVQSLLSKETKVAQQRN